ncbi:MAG: ABC transporter permease [Bacteroidota bacterium]
MSNFNREAAIATWRQFHERQAALTSSDLDELERHLRDQTAQLVAAGREEGAAFREAMQKLGDAATGEAEYGKVYWAKARQQQRIGAELQVRWAMLKTYLVVAARHVRRHPGFAFIHLAGLALGMACTLLIGAYAWQESSFDQFHADAESIFRVNWDFNYESGEGVGPGTPPPLAARFAENIPEIASTIRLRPINDLTVRQGEQVRNESGIVAADPNLFSFFSFELLVGDPETALVEPNSVVLTETAARAYFGDADPMGATLIIGKTRPMFRSVYESTFRVTGIVADPPPTSHITFTMLTSMASHPEVAYFDWSWIWMQVVTYVKLHDPATAEVAQAKMPELVGRFAPDAFARVGMSYEDMMANGWRWDFVLQPMTDVYLGGDVVGNRLGPLGNHTYVRLFLIAGLLVLLIAIINFANLTTAQSLGRVREIGVRKVLGSQRRMLAGQFLSESMAFSLLALPLAVLLVVAALGPFEQLAEQPLLLAERASWVGLAGLVAFAALVGALAGSYPGLYLSSFRPVQVLKGAFRASKASQAVRRVLVVTQFVLTIGLIASALVVQQQMAFLRTTDVGFDREHIVAISNYDQRLGTQAEAFRAQLRQYASIENAAISTHLPPNFGFEDYFRVSGQGDAQVGLVTYLADAYLTETLGLEVTEGRAFEAGRDEARNVLVNEAAVREFGWDDPIGQTVSYEDDTYTVVGVMRDFNALALQLPIVPFAVFHASSELFTIQESEIAVRLAPGDVQAGLAAIEAEWSRFAPDVPLDYAFLDDSFDAQYVAEARLGTLFGVFATIAILIACMGLVGLMAFTAQQRTKEVGVRKVLGASVPSILVLFARDFVALIGVAFVIAAPLAFVVTDGWLDDFAFQMHLGIGVFLATGALVLVIALVTVSYQAISAATADPVESLRYE